MKLRSYIQNSEGMSTRDFVARCGYSKAFYPCLDKVIEYYDSKLSLRTILTRYGVDVPDQTDVMQIPCLLPSHGTRDIHNSARYYSYDRESGEAKEAIYCFKCRVKKTGFSLVLALEREYRGKTLMDVLELMEGQFGIPFPKEILLDFDPDTYFTFEEDDSKIQQVLEAFKRARVVRNILRGDVTEYLAQLEGLYRSL